MTRNDLERLAFNEALSFHAAGVGPEDRAQLLVSLDRLFIAGMAYYRGLIELGVNTFRVGVAPPAMHRHYFELLKPTVLIGVPSFLKKLGAELAESGYDPRHSSIRALFCIGETIRNQDLSLNGLGAALENLYGAQAFSTYGCTELSVAYCECGERTGAHAHPELVYTEILDEEGNPVPDGVPGELVATPLGVEGVPLLRYRTGDITFRIPGVCACGRNSMRTGPILARKSQMIKLKGTTLYPTTITAALDELDCIEDYVLLLEGDEALSDRVTIHVVARPADVLKISEHLRGTARVSFPVLVTNSVTIQSLRGESRKKVHVIDKRRKRSGVPQQS
jgi:phenylacetate-CoA ligase